MTVIATIISKYCCAHASDSLLSTYNNKTYQKIEYKKTKIVAVRNFTGAMAYWGLAKYRNWSTLQWLIEQASKSNQFATPEDFAQFISIQLNQILSGMNFKKEQDKGIGIHFTVYEKVDGIRIPELFVIRNFNGTNYNEILPDGMRVTRETYGNLPETLQVVAPGIDHGKSECRYIVRDYLENGGLFMYNNGDPEMFNSAAASIQNMFFVAAKRGILDYSDDAKTYRKIVKWSIDQVTKMQHEFVKDGQQLVGGKTHNLSITPIGEYMSDTDKV